MAISAVDTISLALDHTWQQLGKPFRFGQWTRLAMVGLLAGELGSGGGCSVPRGFNFPKQPDASRHFLAQDWPTIDPAILGGAVVAIAVLLVALFFIGLVLMYVSSVMRFILFDSILAKECRVREGWGRRQGIGLRYFLWKLAFALISFGTFVVLIGIPAGIGFMMGWFTDPGEHILPLVLGGIAMFGVFLILGIGSAVIYVLTKDFVVPQMALEGIGVMEGWRRLLAMMKAEKGDYIVYLILKIVLALVAAVIIGIAGVILGLLFAVPSAVLAVVAVLAGKSAGLVWNVSTITAAVVAGSVILAVFLYLLSLLSVPAIVFFPAYAMYFFAGRYPRLAAVVYPAAVVPQPVPPLPPAFSPPAVE